MIEIRGGKVEGKTLFFPKFEVLKSYDALEKEVEEAVLAGQVVCVNLSNLNKLASYSAFIARVGVVSLRWGAPRLLLLRPGQVRSVEAGEEPMRVWRLWRYAFDPSTDRYVVGSPGSAEKLIRANMKAGKPWNEGFYRKELDGQTH